MGWGGGCWTLDFSECPADPPGGGAWTLGLSESPTDPLGGGGLDLGLLKRTDPYTRGGVLQSDVGITLLPKRQNKRTKGVVLILAKVVY